MKKALFSTGLHVDDDHLNYAETTKEQAILERMKAIMESPGIPAANLTDDPNRNYLKVVPGDTPGYVKVSLGEAYDANGERIYLSAASDEVEVPTTDTWYNVLIEYAYVDDTVGEFEDGYPAGGETEYTQRHDSYSITVTTDDPTETQLLLAQVRRNQDDTIDFIDKRSDILLQCRRRGGLQTAPATPVLLKLQYTALASLPVEEGQEGVPSLTREGIGGLSAMCLGTLWFGDWGQGARDGVDPKKFNASANESGETWTDDMWIGYKLYLADGSTYEVIDNGPDWLEVDEDLPTGYDGSFWLTPGGDMYEWKLIPLQKLNGSWGPMPHIQSGNFSLAESPVYPILSQPVRVGTKYRWAVRAKVGDYGSDVLVVEEVAGTGEADLAWEAAEPAITFYYAEYGVRAVFPAIDSAKLDNLAGYEYAYTVNDSEEGAVDPTFNLNDTDSIVVRSYQRSVVIPASPGKYVKVSVRPFDTIGRVATSLTLTGGTYAGGMTSVRRQMEWTLVVKGLEQVYKYPGGWDDRRLAPLEVRKVGTLLLDGLITVKQIQAFVPQDASGFQEPIKVWISSSSSDHAAGVNLYLESGMQDGQTESASVNYEIATGAMYVYLENVDDTNYCSIDELHITVVYEKGRSVTVTE